MSDNRSYFAAQIEMAFRRDSLHILRPQCLSGKRFYKGLAANTVNSASRDFETEYGFEARSADGIANHATDICGYSLRLIRAEFRAALRIIPLRVADETSFC
jgi:hypothetical protein